MKWINVSLEIMDKWRTIFSENKEEVNLSVKCPICNKIKLHRYYHVNKYEEIIREGEKYIGRGGLWEWCSSCGNYEHYSVLVPEWWKCDFTVESNKLTTTPDAIEKARLGAESSTI